MRNGKTEMAFEKLVYEHQDIISKVCHIYCHNASQREDLFQDITINLWKGLPAFKGNARISTWIYRVSINTAITAFHKRKKNRLIFSGHIPEPIDNLAETDLNNEMEVKALYTGIKALKAVDRAIILLYLEDKTYEEIAEIIGISIKNVSVRLVRIRKKLKKLVEPLIETNR
jgi:RNA polymerase sigma-70 factor (ECF subfamily)